MNLNTFLPPEDLDETKSQLYVIRAVLRTAVHDYAEQALNAANEVLEIAKSSGPLVDTYMHQHDYREAVQKCQQAVQASMMVSYGILNLEETTIPDIDAANEDYKLDSMHMPKINALLEGAMNRMKMAAHAFPENPQPGSRCNGSVYVQTTNKSDEGHGGEEKA